jgi:hypothetical protein|tara:strand:+ start:720 stop:1124 length:405 start_codon:yes stop_codon:yes gene_type:complete
MLREKTATIETTQEKLFRMCKNISEELTSGKLDKEDYGHFYDLTEEEQEEWEPSGYDYLENVYDIKYVVGGDGQYYGSQLMVAGGGPNIYIDTQEMQVQGYWGSDRVIVHFRDNIGLNDALEDTMSINHQFNKC